MKFRGLVVDGILHTDMRFHNETCTKLAELSKAAELQADSSHEDKIRGLLEQLEKTKESEIEAILKREKFNRNLTKTFLVQLLGWPIMRGH